MGENFGFGLQALFWMLMVQCSQEQGKENEVLSCVNHSDRLLTACVRELASWKVMVCFVAARFLELVLSYCIGREDEETYFAACSNAL